MSEKYYLYRITEDGDASIYGQFESLSMAKMSASLLLIKDFCFILDENVSKIYFYDQESGWYCDIFSSDGRVEFLETYPSPKEYHCAVE